MKPLTNPKGHLEKYGKDREGGEKGGEKGEEKESTKQKKQKQEIQKKQMKRDEKLDDHLDVEVLRQDLFEEEAREEERMEERKRERRVQNYQQESEIEEGEEDEMLDDEDEENMIGDRGDYNYDVDETRGEMDDEEGDFVEFSENEIDIDEEEMRRTVDESSNFISPLPSSDTMPYLEFLPSTLSHLFLRVPLYDIHTYTNIISRLYASLKPSGCLLVFLSHTNEISQLAHSLTTTRRFRVGVVANAATSTERMAALTAAREKKVQILLSTDLSSRGLDFNGVHHVLNLGLPPSTVVYLHRAGRVERMGGLTNCSVITVLNSASVKCKFEVKMLRGYSKELDGDIKEVILEKGELKKYVPPKPKNHPKFDENGKKVDSNKKEEADVEVGSEEKP